MIGKEITRVVLNKKGKGAYSRRKIKEELLKIKFLFYVFRIFML
ncbi:hypothetical protein ABS315_25615 [Peribacillus frigoritolerans]